MRRAGILGLVLVLALATYPTVGAVMEHYWAKTFGWQGTDYLVDSKILENGDIILVGSTRPSKIDYYDIWVMRLDKNGSVKWANKYVGYEDSRTYSVATDGRDIIVAGGVGTSGLRGVDGSILRLDEQGNIKWQRTYGGRGDDWILRITLAPNGDIIAVGKTSSFDAKKWDAWVMRLDGNGNVKWQKTFGSEYDDQFNDVTVADNGDIIIVGDYRATGADGGGASVWVVRLDGNGNVRWQKTYGGNRTDSATAVSTTPDGEILVAGITLNFGAGGYDFWVLRLDKNGKIKWQKTYGDIHDDSAYSIVPVENGDILVGGTYGSIGDRSDADIWILRLDRDGNVKWQKALGGSMREEARLIAGNMGIVAVGYTKSFGAGGYDGLALRLPPTGELRDCSFCREANFTSTVSKAKVKTPEVTIKDVKAVVDRTYAYSKSVTPESKLLWSETMNVTSSPEKNQREDKICGPGAFVGVAMLALLMKKR
ncbi:hypothetical protein A3L09_09815 [Thermococcus profundus]|uniref:Uncharacterized protein n=1 Tax=Thermococcus profundus TaxID=49899 RepID=A0A2Z2MDC2_THEPR|nr:CGP-CTERM sorting domain-containing protein [Thermococcus profundus]ASJ03529.1 hypothetical protein A3L09_09815 [Thermococcus profundus]